jgi:hypothetical protein
VRERQTAALSALLGERIAAFGGSPEALTLVLTGIGRALIMERTLGISAGHESARDWVETLLDRLMPESAELTAET